MNEFISKLLTLIRNPRSEVITTSADLEKVFLAMGLGETWAGITVTFEQAMAYAPFGTSVRVISEGCSQLPFTIFRKDEADPREKTVEPDFHIQKVMKRPNSWQTGIEFRDFCFRHASSTGNAFALRNTVRGQLKELLPLEPGRVRVEQLDDWSMLYHVTSKNGQTSKLKSDRIFHFRGPSDNAISGVNMIHRYRQALALGIAQDRCASNLYSKGALMSGAFTVPGKLTPQRRKDIRESIDEQFSGENASTYALLEGGADFKSMSMTSADSELLESRRLQRGIVGSLLRVPLHMLGDLDKATFSNIMNLARQAVDYTFMPWLIRFETAVEQQLMSEREREIYFAKHNVTSLLRGDPKERAEFYNSGIQNAWLSPNEAREKEDLNPYEGGDEFRPAANLFGEEDPNEADEEDEDDGQRPAARLAKITQAK